VGLGALPADAGQGLTPGSVPQGGAVPQCGICLVAVPRRRGAPRRPFGRASGARLRGCRSVVPTRAWAADEGLAPAVGAVRRAARHAGAVGTWGAPRVPQRPCSGRLVDDAGDRAGEREGRPRQRLHRGRRDGGVGPPSDQG
jgi:hypothetical protein